jgi:hypothetical protein
MMYQFLISCILINANMYMYHVLLCIHSLSLGQPDVWCSVVFSYSLLSAFTSDFLF